LKEKYYTMPWKGMAGVRDRLIHHYFGVNLDIARDIAKNEIPGIEPQITKIMAECEKEP
jgi:uncharacterized protein with HEPN domain